MQLREMSYTYYVPLDQVTDFTTLSWLLAIFLLSIILYGCYAVLRRFNASLSTSPNVIHLGMDMEKVLEEEEEDLPPSYREVGEEGLPTYAEATSGETNNSSMYSKSHSCVLVDL